MERPSLRKGHYRGCAASVAFLIALHAFSLTADAGIFIEPYLQSPSPTSISILWWTDDSHDGSATHWHRLFRRVLTATDPSDPGSGSASRVPFHMVVGNHEIYEHGKGYTGGNLGTAMVRFKQFVHNPPNGASNAAWEERYYTLRYGIATFIVLDANNTSDDAHDNHSYLQDGDTPDWEPGSEQYDWLIAELEQAQQDSAFTFVLFHPAAYSRGTHGRPDDSQSGYHLRVLDPLFRQYGVDAVINSHDHVVERALTGPPGFHTEMNTESPENLNWLTIGNSGHSSRTAEEGWRTWMDITGNDGAPYYSQYFYDWAGKDTLASFILVEFEPLDAEHWRANFRTIRSDGLVEADIFSLTRPAPKVITVAVIPQGNGQVEPAGEMIFAGEDVGYLRLTATPGDNTVFDRWIATGNCEFTNNRSAETRATVRSNTLIQAVFREDLDNDRMADD